jgi:hypothetical protein
MRVAMKVALQPPKQKKKDKIILMLLCDYMVILNLLDSKTLDYLIHNT